MNEPGVSPHPNPPASGECSVRLSRLWEGSIREKAKFITHQ